MLRPLYDWMLLEVVDKPNIAGIVMPESFEVEKEQSTIFRVKAIGDGYILDNGTTLTPVIKVGDKILVAQYSTNKVGLEGESIFISRARDVILIVENEGGDEGAGI